jgi:sulfotransferase family protein
VVCPGNPYVFVVGCPRSGTTLLQRMLDSHPQLAVANEPEFIAAAINGMRPRRDLLVTAEIVERIRKVRTRGGRGFQRLGLPAGALESAAAATRTYPELVAALYSRFAQLRAKEYAGEKTPAYVQHLSLLHTLFPQAKFVHVIRDGRDVTLALLDWAHDPRTGRLRGPARFPLWHTSPVAASALWWSWLVESGRRAAEELGSSYSEVRYEPLVADPETTLRELVDFLELPFDEQMLAYHLRREARPDDPRPGESAWLPVTARIRDWRTQMPAHNVELVEALVGPLLTDLGYERAFRKPSRPVRTEAKGYSKQWTKKLALREARRLSSI